MWYVKQEALKKQYCAKKQLTNKGRHLLHKQVHAISDIAEHPCTCTGL